MAEEADFLHQIEYRWHVARDMSPLASSMAPEPLRGWDSWIRPWVCHPNADEPSESLCYQIHSSGRAALAWRYRNPQVAEPEDGTRGRPLVSRVLAGQASLLTPEVAIALCYTGLPTTVGPRPGQVTAGTILPVVSAGELIALVRERAEGLDREAARESSLLQQGVASMLSEPDIPLAVALPVSYISGPPEKGPQCLLLWGLRRILRPLLGTTRRGWSFSTFEPPLGVTDPAILPDIVFRIAQKAAAPPNRWRREVKCRPFTPMSLL